MATLNDLQTRTVMTTPPDLGPPLGFLVQPPLRTCWSCRPGRRDGDDEQLCRRIVPPPPLPVVARNRDRADDDFAGTVVDVVTTRSVLSYVKDKETALREFYRVLRPGGRIGVFEPINVLMHDPDRLFGYDITRSSRWRPRSKCSSIIFSILRVFASRSAM
jgi:SAM-dependent methyltransferase